MNNENLRFTALCLMAVGQTAFAMLYVTFPWWRSLLGRALFSKALSLMVLLDFYIIARLLDLRDVDWVYTVLYFALSLTIWGQFLAFVMVKRDAAKTERTFPETRQR